MAKIISDNPVVKNIMESMVLLIEEQGGSIHKKIEIRCQNNELSLHSKLSSKLKDDVIFIPDSCLPSIDDFDFQLKGSVITCKAKTDSVVQSQQRIMELLVSLYSETNKFSNVEASIPALFYRDNPEITKSFNSFGHKLEGVAEIDGQALISAFFGTRVVSYYPFGEDSFRRNLLMPLIDSVNHYSRCFSLNTLSTDSQQGLSLPHQKIDGQGDQLFYRYLKMDAMRCFLNYGFFDQAALFVASVPTEITIKEHTFIIDNAQVFNTKKVYGEALLEQIRFYLPSVEHNGNTLELSSIYIPVSENAPVLRLVLQILALQALGISEPNETSQQYVKELEDHIIEATLDFYQSLMGLMSEDFQSENIAMDSALKNTIEFSVKLVQQYKYKMRNYPYIFNH
ncbi:hypothetical protein [Oceanicoccus sagamiensis]|uniref:Uncharacterized protein n=1 Tax=Oceanicoccus sagamiensis TaxID=716816 RepID=A0A1X9NCW9_9GAMM|nr:hypothetical protein [Oceanicoccus sagamiensis]ARN74894.1 hypothetical protein BST96_12675 [Oceanicoccus sagamiensis]